ncbi:histidine phosphatase family protein [uncultured Thiodictyon sp.]|uniref:SixA phosphatase family protein n=1 Tax=uncultured Thiodictyon sp. TaxID=1846217 RepID=UPI0025DDCCDD|nr:histidine phosphatase family protein [uncultured Thiodictyon sp.]
MPRELLILRHAKSDWDSLAVTDFDRPLTERGKHDAPKIGAWLLREGLVPDHVVSSPAERARQTAVKVCKALGIDKGAIVWDPEVYGATRGALLGVLGRCPPGASRVLLIGHNPGLEDLLEHLCGDALELADDGKLLATATLARLEMPADWVGSAPGSARLLSIIRPRNL